MGASIFKKPLGQHALTIGSWAGALVFLSLQGCSISNPLTPLTVARLENNATQAVTVNFCTDPAVQEKFAVKTLVILDHSGSNQQNYLMDPDGDGGPEIVNGNIDISPSYATDPTGILRYGTVSSTGTLLNYLANIPANDPSDPQRYFALVDFNSSVQTYPANSSGFTSNVQGFYNYVQQDATVANGVPQDGGSTDYLGALSAAFNIINNDVNNAAACAQMSTSATPTSNCPQPGVEVASSYVIVFMSDGSPITAINGVGINSSGQTVVTGPIQIQVESTDAILSQVQTIVGLGANTKYVAGINLYTVYYYNPSNNLDLAGQTLLQEMASKGGGLSYSAISGTKIDYSQFLPPSKTIKYTLADVFVTNASAVWWTDGKLHQDTDMDGLPDDVEIAWGSDPNSADTFGYGISDSIEYQLSGGAACASKNAQGICTTPPPNYALNGAINCNGISSTQVGGKTVYTSSDPDGMNDCEKTLLEDVGGIGNPDSNGDIIPDWLEFINGVPFQLNEPSASTSTQTDGYTAYQDIKYSLPANFPVNEILNAQPSQYALNLVSTSSVQDCYNLVVTGLPVTGNQNTVRVDVIEQSELLQDKYLYRVGRKAFPMGSQSLLFNDWNDATEKSLGTWSTWP